MSGRDVPGKFFSACESCANLEHMQRRLILGELSRDECPGTVPEVRVLCSLRSWLKAGIGQMCMWGASNRLDTGNPPAML